MPVCVIIAATFISTWLLTNSARRGEIPASSARVRIDGVQV